MYMRLIRHFAEVGAPSGEFDPVLYSIMVQSLSSILNWHGGKWGTSLGSPGGHPIISGISCLEWGVFEGIFVEVCSG